ncbi:MAG TPA: DUF3570 domain-containing protein [Steroidobacteraceae bacterium]|nr:DUF3570 domain-containing protein [Steroidobacteraceae bacterium]
MTKLWTRTVRASCAVLVAAATLGLVTRADVLPEDRADVMYHRYEGGGVTVEGPSVLVRKKIGDSFSASYQYYLDLITSASIDVLSQASKYKERRTEHHVGLDYLHGNTLYSVGWINSNEPDYKSNTGFFNISQSMFGDLTTVSFGFSRGWDKVYEHAPPVEIFKGDADHRTWTLGLSQVLTRNLLLGINYETSENAGYLQSPYRQIRFVDNNTGRVTFGPATTPNTRTGNAVSAQAKYYLPWHAAVDANYRYYTDTWDIQAHTIRLGYTQPWHAWTFDASARYYRQTAADFYSDVFPFENAQNFESRDRELAQFHSLTLGVGAAWEFKPTWPSFIQKGTVNADFQHMRIDYDDFRNELVDLPNQNPSAEPLYSYGANIMQFFISVWY